MSDFSSKATQVSNNLKRSMVDAGVKPRPGVPLHPLLTSVASATEVMGQMIDAMRAEINTIKAAAVAGSEAALQEALKDMVNKAGADMAATAKYKAIVVASVVLSVICVGAYYCARYMTDTWADAKIAKIEENYSKKLHEVQNDSSKLEAWSKGILGSNSTDDAPWPCIGWGKQGFTRTDPPFRDGLHEVVTCAIALRWKYPPGHK